MICSACSLESHKSKDGLCPTCRLRKHRVTPTYAWTAEMDAELTRQYRTAHNKTALSAAISALAARHRMPRYIIQNRAQRLNLRTRVQRLWTSAEIGILNQYAGTTTMEHLAKRLGRSASSVKQKLFALKITGRYDEGYSQNELAQLLGVHRDRVGRWLRRGWLDLDDTRITQVSVERFVWEHMDEYRFAGCEEMWLKSMLLAKPRLLAGLAVDLGRIAA